MVMKVDGGGTVVVAQTGGGARPEEAARVMPLA